MGTSGIKTVAGCLSAAGGACILMATGPVMPLVAIGTGGLIVGSMGNYGMAKLEQFLSSKKVRHFYLQVLLMYTILLDY
jgi:hypothetical protein